MPASTKKINKQTGTKRTKVIPSSVTKAMDTAGAQIERAAAEATLSKQPRFTPDRKSINQLFQQIYGFAKGTIYDEPPYQADSTRRDTWLAKVVLKEPYLLGILQSVVSIDKNRGWTLVGGKIQVKRFVQILHNFQVAADLAGWRNGLSVSSRNYYNSDLGTVVEIGRSAENGPLAAMYTVDPTKCVLTGTPDTPLKYNNGARDKQMWQPNDYFRVPSFPSPAESMNGLGYCAVSRCIELAKVLVSVIEHDREQLGSKAPKGILTINGLTQEQWLQSLEESSAELKTLEREFYSGVQVLADETGEVKVELTSFSNLPTGFKQEEFINMIIYGYALAFGYDPREFWPVSSGSMGTATETENQHRRASSKGGLDFALGFQEKLQDELPDTLEFEFEQRDVQGDIAEADFQKKELDIIKGMYETSNADGKSLVDYDEARQLMVEANLIPDEWTANEEEDSVTDTDDLGVEQLLEKQRVQNAISKFPKDDIVVYSSRKNKYRTIRAAGAKKFSIAVKKPLKKKVKSRAYDGDYTQIRAAFHDATYTVVRDYLNSSDRATSYKSAMNRNVVEAYGPAAEQGYIDGGGDLPLDDDANDWITAAQSAELGYVDSLFVSLKQLRDSGEFDAENEATARADGYASSLDGVYNTAAVYGAGNKMLTFQGDDGEHSCRSCTKLYGQRHKASWWIAHDYVPPTGSGLDCSAGGKCMHELVTDDGEVVTI